MNQNEISPMNFTQSERNNFDDQSQMHEGNSQHEAVSDAATSFNIQLQAQELEKEFVFNFRTFKEVFPYISSVCVSDHSNIEEAYSKCIQKHLAPKKKKFSILSNIVVVQFHKIEYEK